MLQTPRHGTFLQECKGNHSAIFAGLPSDIVRLILEHLGRDSRKDAARLVRVSRIVHGWILPILYETMRFENAKRLDQILRTLSAHPELASYVHNVGLQLEMYSPVHSTELALARDVAALFLQCRHVRSVYLSSNFRTLRFNNAQFPRLQDLHYSALGSAWLIGDIFMFRTVTHLRLDIKYNPSEHKLWAPLCGPPPNALPHLTHLALYVDAPTPPSYKSMTLKLVGEVLAARLDLVMLVTMFWTHPLSPLDEEILMDIADPRLCVLTNFSRLKDVSPLARWERTVRGMQSSIWAKAGAVMESHKACGGHGIAVGSI